MRKNLTTGVFTIMIMVMIVLAGCATDTISIGERDAPTPVLVDGPVRVVSAAPPGSVTLQPSGTITPAPTLSEACQGLLAATDDDRAFVQAIADRKVYAGICSLANNNCTIRAATDISQVISTSPTTQTPLVVQAREHLLSASTYCLDPTNSASRNRTRNDLDIYVGRMSRYAFLVFLPGTVR